jgi:glycosyltransferase involved in cell wall biosynthesis
MLLRAIRRIAPTLPIIYHAHNVEYLLRLARNGRAIAAITGRAEGRLLAQCDLATAVSEVDRTHFRELYNVSTALLPNGVDVDRLASVSSGDTDRIRRKYHVGESALIFSGLYAYPPNRAAVDFLRRDVMPRLTEHIPRAQLIVTGGEVPQAEPWLVSAGLVPYEDLPALLTACKVAAVPVFSGSGTRLKILEAMAAGVPVVATGKGAEGLGLRHRKHFLLANDKQEFVDAIAAIFETSSMAANLRKSAKQKVSAEFSWRRIVDDFEQAITRMSIEELPAELVSFAIPSH